VTRLINELREWCSQKYGRQAQVARTLRVTRARVNDWITGRTVPSLSEGLALIEFLKAEHPKKTKTTKPSDS
jgi:predicted XRE-type DNA-binding protein